MAKKDYVPRKDVDFIVWGKGLDSYATENCERWKIPPPKEFIEPLFTEYIELQNLSMGANCRKLDISKKNEARKVVEKAFRNYIQGFIARNVLVTVNDRKEMMLNVPDSVPTPAADPTGMATAEVKYPGSTQLMLHIKHVDGTDADTKANYGCRIYYGVYPHGTTPPESGKNLHQSRFTRLKKELFIFEPEDSAKTAWFCIRYENSKGKQGPWGRMFSAVIP